MKLVQLLAVLAWRYTGNFGKSPKKIGIIAESALESDTVQAFISQHLLSCQHYTAVQDIIVYTPVCEPGEFMGKIGRTDIEKPLSVYPVFFRL